MDWDDEFKNGYGYIARPQQRSGSMTGEVLEGGRDALDITDPANAYFLLSDDAQDEITGSGRTRMKCLSCGHTFRGETYDSCSECFSPDTEEVIDEKDDGYW